MNWKEIEKSHEFNEALKIMTRTFAIIMAELIAVIALVIWPNKLIMFLVIVIGLFLVTGIIATYFSIRELKRKI